MTALPGTPGTRLQAVWSQLTPEEQQALLPHLLGDTGAERLALLLTNASDTERDLRIGATSIKSFRRSLTVGV